MMAILEEYFFLSRLHNLADFFKYQVGTCRPPGALEMSRVGTEPGRLASQCCVAIVVHYKKVE